MGKLSPTTRCVSLTGESFFIFTYLLRDRGELQESREKGTFSLGIPLRAADIDIFHSVPVLFLTVPPFSSTHRQDLAVVLVKFFNPAHFHACLLLFRKATLGMLPLLGQ